MHSPDSRTRPRGLLAASLGLLLRRHRPRMLVVEDDRDLEPLVRRALSSLDPPVAVEWCTSAEHAAVRLRAGYYDLVLADYVLEGERAGLSLRGDCWTLQPQAVFAMTSSYPLDDYLHSVGGPGSPFLPKPYDVPGCRRFVQALLARENGAPR